MNFYNHIPNARRLAAEADVRWAGSSLDPVLEELGRRGAKGASIGVIGPLGFRTYEKLAAFAVRVVDLGAAYSRLRTIKSMEEIEWVRVGAALTDAAMRALRAEARVGTSERELGDIVERAYVPRGGTTHIHYFAATDMSAPEVSVPAQWPSTRELENGDALSCEISASLWDHPGQLLRTFTIGSGPTALYRELHSVADAAFDAILDRLRPGATATEIVDAAAVVEDAGFTTRDDLVHGFVGGYLPPVLGTRGRMLEPVPNFTFEAGMTVVVQPNVVTRDERAGVQTGELVLLTSTGAERLHDFERGLGRIG